MQKLNFCTVIQHNNYLFKEEEWKEAIEELKKLLRYTDIFPRRKFFQSFFSHVNLLSSEFLIEFVLNIFANSRDKKCLYVSALIFLFIRLSPVEVHLDRMVISWKEIVLAPHHFAGHMTLSTSGLSNNCGL